MICEWGLLRLAELDIKPACRRQCEQHMLVRAPSEGLGSVLDLVVGVSRDLIGDRDIDPCRFDSYELGSKAGDMFSMTVL